MQDLNKVTLSKSLSSPLPLEVPLPFVDDFGIAVFPPNNEPPAQPTRNFIEGTWAVALVLVQGTSGDME